MKKYLLFVLLNGTILSTGFGQCNGGTAFGTIAAPSNNVTNTITTCSFTGDYNTITGVVAGNTYTIDAIQNNNGNNRCITVHTGSASGPVVAFGMGTVTFTAPSSGTYYIAINQNCTGCGTANINCITTSITCNSCVTGPCVSPTNIPGCGQGFTINTTGASSYIANLCSTGTPGLELVYTYTATSTGNYSFNVTSVTGGGYAIGWLPASSGCSPTGWNCAGVATVPGSVGSIALTAGTTYYFVFDATSTAASSIGFSLTCPSGGPTTAGDCNVAANVCSNASFSIDPSGFGAIDEICTYCTANPSINVNGSNSGCLLSGELNSTWMIVNVLTGGSLQFSMGTPNSGNMNCLDWSMWPYSPTACAGISAGTLAPVRCNYNGACEEFTGIAGSLPTGASSMTNWEAPLTVGSSTQYLICLSNYSSAVTTVPLSFGGTAVVSCSPLGIENITLEGINESGYNELKWACNLELNTKEFIVERSSDGINFKEISKQDAFGFSTIETNYSYSDLNPINGMNYYRVVSIHDNAAPVTSDLIAIEHFNSKNLEVLKCFPNPADDELTILVNSIQKGAYQFQLTDINGKIVFTSNQTLDTGINQYHLNISSVDKGFYMLHVLSNNKRIETQKIIIE